IAFINEYFQNVGVKVLDMGVTTTPAVSCVVREQKALCGVVISASHNPPEFNGVKFFSSSGEKLSEELEERVESRLKHAKLPSGAKKANCVADPAAQEAYAQFILSSVPDKGAFKGLSLALDCANGAACGIAPEIFKRLGAEIVAIGCTPNGGNINTGCGALDTAAMQKAACSGNMFAGVSLDGDADRAIFSDEQGELMDGDDIMALAAPEMKKAGRLAGSRVALTVMSNYGLRNYLKANGISVSEVPVGDKYVSRALEAEKLMLGGESSGHMIFREFSPTGDGILTAVQTLALALRAGKPMSWFRKQWERYPSLLRAVPVKKKVPLADVPGFEEVVLGLEKKFNGKGRLLVRYSGTEPKLRILAEGADKKLVESAVEQISQFYKKHTEEAL
ncbi:MAG TPA: hypothetical protein PLL10_10400, partial [Elusimicrobiales bacterium]|nr:hypothetical protein [Elusimicrobiales bacterium]